MKKLTPEFLQHLQRLLSDPEWLDGFRPGYQALVRESAVLTLMTGRTHRAHYGTVIADQGIEPHYLFIAGFSGKIYED